MRRKRLHDETRPALLNQIRQAVGLPLPKRGASYLRRKELVHIAAWVDSARVSHEGL